MTASIWDELAIPPTDDAAAIRRAYAVRLKRCRPDDDTAAFVRLRAAYETALRGAVRRPPPEVPPPELQTPPEFQLISPASRHDEPAPEKLVATAIARGDVQTAATLLLAARGDSTLPIGRWMWLTEHLAWRLAQDRNIDDAVVEAIARQFGWFGGSEQTPTAAIQTLRIRIDAAAWIARVRADATKISRFFGNERAAACALLLGHGRLTVSGLLPPYAQLLEVLSGLQAHGASVERRLNVDRVARLRALMADARGQLTRRYLAVAVAGGAFAAIGQAPLAMFVMLAMLPIRLAWLRPCFMALLGLAAVTALAGLSGDMDVQYETALTVAFFLGVFGFAAMARIVPVIRRGPREIARLAGRFLIWLAIIGTICTAAENISGLHGLGGLAAAGVFVLLLEVIRRLMHRRRLNLWRRGAPRQAAKPRGYTRQH